MKTDSEVRDYMLSLHYKEQSFKETTHFVKEKQWVSFEEARRWLEYEDDHKKMMSELLFGEYFKNNK